MKAKDKSAAVTPDLLGQKRIGRPPKADAMTNAERQRKYRQKRVLVDVGVRMTQTVESLARDFDLTEAEVTTHLIRFALLNRNWRQTGF